MQMSLCRICDSYGEEGVVLQLDVEHLLRDLIVRHWVQSRPRQEKGPLSSQNEGIGVQTVFGFVFDYR